MFSFISKIKYNKLVKEAYKLKDEGKVDEAIAKFFEAFQIIINVDDYIYVACLYIDQGKYDQAIHIFEDIEHEHQIKPISRINDVYFGLGVCHDTLKQEGLALDYYEKAIKEGCMSPECYYFAATLYDDLADKITEENNENILKAIKYYKKAIELYDKYLYAYVNLANIYARIGKYKESLDLFLKAKELDKDNDATSNYNLGVAYTNVGDLEKAEYYYLEELKCKEPYPATYYNLGLLYKDKKEYDKSKYNYLKAIELDKTDYNSWYNLGCLYALMKDYDNAFECFEYLKYNKNEYLKSMATDDELVDLIKDERYKKLFEL